MYQSYESDDYRKRKKNRLLTKEDMREYKNKLRFLQTNNYKNL